MREATLVKEVKDWINSNGGKVVKYHGGPYSEAGIPDLIGCLPHGQCVVIECKVPGKHPTPIQLAQLKAFIKCGAVVIVGDNFEKIKKTLSSIIFNTI